MESKERDKLDEERKKSNKILYDSVSSEGSLEDLNPVLTIFNLLSKLKMEARKLENLEIQCIIVLNHYVFRIEAEIEENTQHKTLD